MTVKEKPVNGCVDRFLAIPRDFSTASSMVETVGEVFGEILRENSEEGDAGVG